MRKRSYPFWRGARSVVAAALLLLVFPHSVRAVDPADRLAFQGRLTDASGLPLAGSYDFVFRFYDAPTGGTLLLTDTHTLASGGRVTAAEGIYTVVLGTNVTAGTESTLSGAFRDVATVYLSITIEGEALSPRLPLYASGAALHAANAQRLGGVDVSSFVQTTGATMTGTLAVPALTLNGDTRTSWPAGGGGTVDGSGTINAVTYWADADTLASEAALSTSRGGTGQNWSGTAGGSLPWFSGAGTLGVIGGPGGSGQVLRSSGANTFSWSALVSGDLPADGYASTYVNAAGADTMTGTLAVPSLTLNGVNRTSWPVEVGGSGTANYLPKFTAATTLGNSTVYDSGTNVGIGTITPSSRLQVSGDARVTGHGAVGANGAVQTAETLRVQENFTGLGGGNSYSLATYQTRTEASTITSTTVARGTYNSLTFRVTEDLVTPYNASAYATDNVVTADGAYTYNWLRGSNNTAYTTSTATANQDALGGSVNSGYLNSAGVLTSAYGSYNQAYNSSSGTLSNAYGAYNYAFDNTGSTGVVTTARGSYNRVRNASTVGGAVTTARAVEALVDKDAAASDPTNAYLFYGNITAGLTKWGLYLTGESKSYLSGSLGIGNSTPGYKLDVTGDARLTGDLTVSGASTNFRNAVLAVDGAGSGVDADLLDGQSSAYYLDAGNVNAGSLADARLSSNVALLARDPQTFTGQNIFRKSADSTTAFQVLNAAGTVAALSADTTNTRLGIGTAAPSRTLHVYGAASAYPARVSSPDGYLDFGPANTGWSHFSTDRASFWFNTRVTTDGNVEPYTDNTRSLGTSSKRWSDGQFGSLTLGGVNRTTWPIGANGSGTANYVAKFTAADTIANSIMTDNGSTVAVGGNLNVGDGTAYGDSRVTISGTAGNNDAALTMVKRDVASRPVWSVLPWDSQVYISAGIYYSNSAWVHNADDGNNQLFTMDPGNGIRWYASNNSAGSWNVASNIQLWDDGARWKSSVQSTRAEDSYISGGNLGVGNAAPGYKLDVTGTGNFSSGLRADTYTTTWGGWNVALQFPNASHAMIHYPTGGIGFGLHSNRNFYWADTTNGWYSMWLTPAGSLESRTDMRAPIFYDSNNTAYYVDPASTSLVNVMRADGGYQVDGNTVIDADAGWHRTYGATGWYNQTYAGGWYMADTTWIRSYNSKNVYCDVVVRADGGFQVDGNTVIDADAGWHRTYGNTGWYNGTYGGGWYMTDSTWVQTYNGKSVYSNTGNQASIYAYESTDNDSYTAVYGDCNYMANAWAGFFEGDVQMRDLFYRNAYAWYKAAFLDERDDLAVLDGLRPMVVEPEKEGDRRRLAADPASFPDDMKAGGTREAMKNAVSLNDLLSLSLGASRQLNRETKERDAVLAARVEALERGATARGEARLEAGAAVVTLPAEFVNAIGADNVAHVQVTLLDDCRGVYVANRTPQSFTVKELQAGESNARFLWIATAPGDAASGAGGGAGGGQPVDFRAINERLGVTSTRDIVAENQRLLREGKTTGFLSFADDPGPAQPAAPGK